MMNDKNKEKQEMARKSDERNKEMKRRDPN